VSSIIQQLCDELTNLTPIDGRFWGRETVQSQVIAALQTTRLVTLVGPGGVGKTRLAHAVASTFIGENPGGVWWIDLAEATTIDELTRRFATTLGLQLTGKEPVAALGQVLKHRPSSVYILDNLEQLTGHLGACLGQWLQDAHHCRFLATSREVLRLPSEQVIPVEPLTMEAAVQLFVGRVQARRPAFQLNETERETVQKLVNELDRLPLALELAAGRAAFLGVDALYNRLSERFNFLADRNSNRPKRHGRLEDTIAWSWALLEPWEQSLLAQSSVFHDAFEPIALAEVAVLSAWPDAPWAVDIVQSLIDKSLLRSQDGHLRHFVSIRQFAAARLSEDEHIRVSDLKQKHALWYADRCEAMASHPSAPVRVNLIAAATEGTGDAAIRCAVLVFNSRTASDHRSWLHALLDAKRTEVDVNSRSRLLATIHLAYIETADGQYASAQQRLEGCEEVLNDREDIALSTRLTMQQSLLLWRRDQRIESANKMQQVQVMAHQSGDLLLMAVAKREMSAQIIWDNVDEARKVVEESIDLFQRAGKPPNAACFVILGETHRMLGRWRPAIAAYTQITHQMDAVKPLSLLQALTNQIEIHLQCHQHNTAKQLLNEAETLALQCGHRPRQILLTRAKAQIWSREAKWDAVRSQLSLTREQIRTEQLPAHRLRETDILLAPALWRMNEMEEADALYRGVDEFYASFDSFGEQIGHYYQLNRSLLEGRLVRAADHGTRALASATFDRFFFWNATSKLVQIHRRTGHFNDANRILETTIPLLRKKEIPGWVSRLLTDQAYVAGDQDQWSVATRCLDEAQPLSAHEGDIYNLIRIHLAYAQIHRAQKAWSGAAEHLDKAEALWPTSQCVALRGLIALERGRVLVGQSQKDAAKSVLAQAAADLHRAGDRWDWVAALCWQARAEDELELIQRYTQHAQQTIDDIGETSAVEIVGWVRELQAVLNGQHTAHVLVLIEDKALNASIGAQLLKAGHRVSSAHSCAELEGHLTEPIEAMVLQVPTDGEFTATFNWLRYGMGASWSIWVGPDGPSELPQVDPQRVSTLPHRVSEALMNASPPASQVLLLGETRVDLVRREIHRDGEVQPLREMEARLIAYLAAQSERVIPREELLKAVWGYTAGVGSRTLDTTVARLRKKIERQPREPAYLFTVRRQGYCLKHSSWETLDGTP